MDKVEIKELVKAISGLTKVQQNYNKNLENLITIIKDSNEVNKTLATRLLKVSESLDNVKNTQANV